MLTPHVRDLSTPQRRLLPGELRNFLSEIFGEIDPARGAGYRETIPRLMAYWMSSAVVSRPSFSITSYL